MSASPATPISPPQDEGFDVDDDFRCQMQKLLHKRKRMAVVRLECAAPLSEALSAFLCKRCHVAPAQIFLSRAPMRMGFVHPMLKKAAGAPPQCAVPALLPPDAPQAQAGDLSPPGPAPGSALSYPFESMGPSSAYPGGRLRPVGPLHPDPSTAWPRGPARGYICAAAKTVEVTAS